jgi:hypothetical protein
MEIKMVPLVERSRQSNTGTRVVHSANSEKISNIHVVPIGQVKAEDVVEFGTMAMGLMGSLLLIAYLATIDWYEPIRVICAYALGLK